MSSAFVYRPNGSGEHTLVELLKAPRASAVVTQLRLGYGRGDGHARVRGSEDRGRSVWCDGE